MLENTNTANYTACPPTPDSIESFYPIKNRDEIWLLRKPNLEQMFIGQLVDIFRRSPHGDDAKTALNHIYDLLLKEYPPYRYQANFSIADLECQLLVGIRDNNPVVVGFIEEESKNHSLWKWRIHFVEIAGLAAVLSDMLVSMKSPDIGVWR